MKDLDTCENVLHRTKQREDVAIAVAILATEMKQAGASCMRTACE